MSYNIFKDSSFYLYVILFVSSAIVFINSIRRLSSLNDLEDGDENERVDEEVTQKDDEVPVSSLNPTIVEEDGKIEVEGKQEKEIEKMEFDNESDDSLFKTASVQKEEEHKEEVVEKKRSAAEEYLLSLNNILEEIREKLSDLPTKKDILSLQEKISNIEKQVQDNIVKENFESQSETKNNSATILSDQPITPKYIYKYIEDIVDDYENIDKEMIRKRLSIILSELKSISKDTED
ncbi:MAG: hypothetical protein K6357_03355 [Elusimicrobiota bacterium]